MHIYIFNRFACHGKADTKLALQDLPVAAAIAAATEAAAAALAAWTVDPACSSSAGAIVHEVGQSKINLI